MISPAVFKKHGCDTASLKKLFELPKNPPKRTGKKASVVSNDLTETDTGEKPGIRRLRSLIRSRIQEGRTNNLRDYRIFASCDFAYDAPFHQTTPTIARHVADQKMTYEESLKVIEGWGLCWEDCFRKRLDENGKEMRDKVTGAFLFDVNGPSLVRTLIPLVKAYVTVRVAKLYTDRDQIPLFKFEPIRATQENKILCEVLTNIIEGMVTQFGYRAELKDIILHTLLYGICLTFPQEAWYCEKQENEEGKEITIKEGLRYLQPHPTRFFYDLMYRTSSFNSDTGCTFGGHWRVVRYGEIFRNKHYFNKEVIPFGTNWFENTYAGTYFSDFYPCTALFPSCRPVSETNREDRAAIYTIADEDKAIFLTEMFMRLVPKDWDMGDYEHLVWFRFVMASDDTVIYAEPLAYTPPVYYGYDADGARVRNASMALELLPFQDQLGNILSQILLTTKQNLANVTFFDKNIINAAQIRSLKNSGELALRGLNFVEYDGEVNSVAGLNVEKAFHVATLPKMGTAELVNTLNTVISMAERMLAFSAQELGGTASHQQSAQEIRTISGSVGVRVAYTGTFIDDGIDAWKTQIAHACMAYMDPEFVALISPDIPDLDKHLKKLGFTLEGRGGGQVKARVRASKKAIMPLILEGLASTRDGPDRGTDQQAATMQMQTWQAIANNPALAQDVGVRTILKGMEEAAKLGGADRDFKLEPSGSGVSEAPEQADAQMGEQVKNAAVQEAVQQTTSLIAEQVIKPAAEKMAQQDQQIAQLAQEVNAVAKGAAETQMAVQKLVQIVTMAQQAQAAPPMLYDQAPAQSAPPVDPALAAGAGPGVPSPMAVQPGAPPL